MRVQIKVTGIIFSHKVQPLFPSHIIAKTDLLLGTSLIHQPLESLQMHNTPIKMKEEPPDFG